MASPKSIPSRVSGGAGTFTTENPIQGRKTQLYITAILTNTANLVVVDSFGVSTTIPVPGPVSLSSPIQCNSFTTNAVGQVAFYEQ